MTTWVGTVLTASTVLLIYWLVQIRLLLAGDPLARRF